MSNRKTLGRREFLRLSMIATSGAVISACAPQAAPSPTSAAAPPTKAAAPAPTVAPAAAAPTQAAAPKLDFPTKGRAISLIVPWPAGGSADVGSRLVAASLEKQVGVPVEVINKAGAGSQTGITEFAQSKPDGYTLAQMPTPTFMTFYLDPDRKATFTLKSFQPIAAQMEIPGCLAVKSDSPYKSVKDLVDAAKAKPKEIKVGTAGLMGQTHLQLVLLQKEAGVQFTQVNFDGGAPLVTALLGGHVDVASGLEADYLAQAKSGELRILGVMSKSDSKFLPGVKSLESQGYRIYLATTRQIAAPAGTPKEIVDYLAGALKKAMEDPNYIKKMDDGGFQRSETMMPDQINAYWTELEKQIKELMDLAKQQG